MIKLKIKDPGHVITMPGLKRFRTPAVVDISKLNVQKVILSLKAAGIHDYEISSSMKDEIIKPVVQTITPPIKKQIITNKIPKHSEDRISRLERMVEQLLNKKDSKDTSEKEQINKQLDRIENLFSNRWESKQIKKTEPEIEDIDTFIPEVNISDMKLTGGTIKTMKQEVDSIESAADMLSNLIKK